MIATLKKIKQKLEFSLFPQQYKEKYFRQIAALNWQNIHSKNIENELLLIRYFLEKDSVFIDVGANLGQYLFVAESIIDQNKGHICGFEPHPYLASRLEKIFPKTEIIQKALSDAIGKAQFKVPFFKHREIHTRGTLKTNHIETDETNFKLLNVEIDTLDTFVKSKDLRKIDVIKIDVEGAEFDVLKGASDSIKQFKPVLIVEIEQRHHDQDVLKFISDFEREFDYQCHYFDADEQELKSDLNLKTIDQLQSADNHGKNRMFINNFIFIPNSKSGQLNKENIHKQIRNV